MGARRREGRRCADEAGARECAAVDNRHPVVHLGHMLVCFGNDHCARLQAFIGLLVFPIRPQTCERDRLSVAAREIVRLLAAWRVLPFVMSARGDQQALGLECIAEHRIGRDGFRPRVEDVCRCRVRRTEFGSASNADVR
jgi:hypothetical protein